MELQTHRESILGYIHCCSGKRKTQSYAISPRENFFAVELDYLEKCPICGHTVVQLTRIDFNNNISYCRKINQKARKLFEELKNSILYKKQPEISCLKAYSKFYLNYNEYGVKKRCYANLSSLKMGLLDNEKFLN